MTLVQAVRLGASAWVPRGQDAVQVALVDVAGSTVRLVPDLCRHLESRLAWARYGESVRPMDTLPTGVLDGNPAGALVIGVQQGQPAPTYGDQLHTGSSLVRLDLLQVMMLDGGELADLSMYYQRRVEIEQELVCTRGWIGREDPTGVPG